MIMKAYAKKYYIFVLFSLYAVLRGVVWSNTFVLEDHDSASYLIIARYFLELNFESVWNSYPDLNPLYSILVACLALVFGDIEFSARLLSFLSSILLFYAVFKLAERFQSEWLTGCVLLLLAVNPVLIELSSAVLTEPLYIAICTYGFYLVLEKTSDLKVSTAILIGVLFGLAFLTRTEGVMFILVVPVIVFAQRFVSFIQGAENWSGKVFSWSATFVLVFCLVALPQLLVVSLKMDKFALNGRQVWSAILQQNPDKPYSEKIYGLDYSEDTINLRYLQQHPTVLAADKVGSIDIKGLFKHIYSNLKELLLIQMTKMMSVPGVILCLVGFWYLIRSVPLQYSLSLILYLGAVTAAPLWHNVVIRHVAILLPILFIIVGLGIRGFTTQLVNIVGFRGDKFVFGVGLIGLVYVFSVRGIMPPTQPAMINNEYNPAEMASAVFALEENVAPKQLTSIKVSARKNYIELFSGAQFSPIPYGTFEQMMTYVKLNSIDFLFFEERLLKKYPFFKEVNSEGFQDSRLKLLWENSNAKHKYSLYRVEQQNLGIKED